MSTPPLTSDLALRIGLAARALPDTDPRRLMAVLLDILQLPLTEEKLQRLTVQQLRSAREGEYGHLPLPVLKRAVDYLWGKAGVELDAELPPPQPYAPGDMPDSIRIAVASNGGEQLDGHFGTCARFLIYQVSPQEIRLVEVRAATTAEAVEDKNSWRAELIADCHVVLVVSIGGPAAAKVVRREVHPVKVGAAGDARAQLAQLQQVLRHAPPPWLAKVMGRAAEERVRFERTEP